MLGVSAIAWAWHVDIPIATDEAAQVANGHAHEDNGDVVDRCDHCCHAGAHLVALAPSLFDADFESTTDHRRTSNPALTTLQTDPPFIPPIA
ncbi:MAG: hypothetical protein RIF37_03870 [Rhodospirillaceae bacterium]